MNKYLLNTDVQNFIDNNLDSDLMSVLLQKQIFEEVSQKELVQQIEAKKKCQKKLPTWFNTKGIYYPKKLNIEQTSSEETADYKSQLVVGKTLADLTGGFGVDSYYFSRKFNMVYSCEITTELAQISNHNFTILNAKNIEAICENGISYLNQSTDQFDCVYLDPSRRNNLKGKVFKFEDCAPNIVEHLEEIFTKTNVILVKSSPLMDLSLGVNDLKFVQEIHIIAINNEVKELLWLLKKGFQKAPDIITINIKNEAEQRFEFNFENEINTIASFSKPLQYLFEPNAAILKSGAFKLVSTKLHVKKLHKHTHLYTSNSLSDFPGRRFLITSFVPYNKKEIKKLKIEKANISVRNFPESVAQIRKKHKIQDGGDVYLFFTKALDNNLIALICTQV